eukprot:CAMPEP_0204511822 /NCGR_PEP_ID=MMETSP0661-20131031/638_1 /ASSEMBLY_ACC=CAM_ASM_000606 /TAXON_ID=109239 /ORGANISM="Alexandrium margalefi, Strain AMGDE01CS-322" /LENGTH=71 /DNA_ID=CAMNT_0051516923 /DNA_START=87 /DNA_END=298 /DNA_ORIENTATION=-
MLAEPCLFVALWRGTAFHVQIPKPCEGEPLDSEWEKDRRLTLSASQSEVRRVLAPQLQASPHLSFATCASA